MQQEDNSEMKKGMTITFVGIGSIFFALLILANYLA